MTELIFMLVLALLAAVLSAIPLFGGSRKQKEYMKNGMKLVNVPRGKQMLLPALGIFCAAFTGFFLFLALSDGAWEEAGNMILLCSGIVILLLIVCFLGGYCLQRRHILYDEEKILVRKPFRPYEEIRWYELSRMKIKNQDFFDLYDRNDMRRISVDAGMEGYLDFYQAALCHIKPSYRVASGEGTAYQKRFSVQDGCGILRYRMGEYYTLFVLSLLVTAMFFVLIFSSGEGIQNALNLLLEEKLVGALFIPVFLLGSTVALIYVSLQRITYDREKIIFQRFPHKKITLLWRDIAKAECVMDKANSRKLILYTRDKIYTIRETQFRKGFPELLHELSKMLTKNK